MRQQNRLLILLFAILLSCGCGTLSSLNPRYLLASSDEKAALLDKRVATFHRAMYWGDTAAMLAMIEPENRRPISNAIRERLRTEHLVDVVVERIEMEETGEAAQVFTRVRYYKVPNFVVRQRVEKEQWLFKRFDGGWFLAAQDELQQNEL